MKRVNPLHGILLVLLIAGTILGITYVLEGGFHRADYQKIMADTQGLVTVEVGSLDAGNVQHFRFINAGHQEVFFFVGRDKTGQVHVAFDANEICYKLKRGYRHQGEWVVCNKCDKAFELVEVNAGGGGCKPVPLDHQVQGDQVLIRENDVLAGWRYFR